MKPTLLLILISVAQLTYAQQQHLFNGKNLEGWDTYIGPPLNDSGKSLNNVAVGLNNDPKKVFSVVEIDGEKVIRISGELFGGISTEKEFSNFHLQLKYKWGKGKWGPKKNQRRDSGLLYHCVGPHGADYGFWMRSQEFQIEEGNTGDYWGVAGGTQDIHAVKVADKYVYDSSGEVHTFSEKSEVGRHCVKKGMYEVSDQWNTVDLYCYKDTSVHVVNGHTVMVLFNSRQIDGSGLVPLIKGKIQIQSEGAEVFYKDLIIKSISEISTDILKRF